MTNEELALDILANNKALRTQTPPLRGKIYDALIELANKKDGQLKEYLEKKKTECIEARRPYGLYDKRRAYLESKERIIQQIINDFLEEK